jgi:glycosyltransferase involved in cell wall biosynthesis
MFVDNLVRLLRDSDLRRRLGARAREDAQRFAIDRHAESLIRTYSALLIARSNLAHRHRMEA